MKKTVYRAAVEIGDNLLKCGDQLHFSPKLHYEVNHNSIVKTNDYRFGEISNDEIFHFLGINEEEIETFCLDHYGYKPHFDRNVKGQFPRFELEDFPAITKLVKAFFNKIESQNNLK